MASEQEKYIGKLPVYPPAPSGKFLRSQSLASSPTQVRAPSACRALSSASRLSIMLRRYKKSVGPSLKKRSLIVVRPVGTAKRPICWSRVAPAALPAESCEGSASRTGGRIAAMPSAPPSVFRFSEPHAASPVIIARPTIELRCFTSISPFGMSPNNFELPKRVPVTPRASEEGKFDRRAQIFLSRSLSEVRPGACTQHDFSAVFREPLIPRIEFSVELPKERVHGAIADDILSPHLSFEGLEGHFGPRTA